MSEGINGISTGEPVQRSIRSSNPAPEPQLENQDLERQLESIEDRVEILQSSRVKGQNIDELA
mgnify:CR=1 FL=1